MGSDASRIFATMYDGTHLFLPYDYSGTEWYRAAEPQLGASTHVGQLQGFSIATTSGDRVITGSPGMPGNGYTTRVGEVRVYEYPLRVSLGGTHYSKGILKLMRLS